MRVATVVGNRPQFVKAAAVSPPLRERHEEILIHTGQHHDEELSAVFFEELALRSPITHSRSPAARTARSSGAWSRSSSRCCGGSSRTWCCSTATPTRRSPGRSRLRTAAWPWPMSRPACARLTAASRRSETACFTDQLAALLLCSSAQAVAQLQSRGRAGPGGARRRRDGRRGARAARARARTNRRARTLRPGPGGYVLATAHRPANVDDPLALERLVALLEAIGDPVIMPLHPRTRARSSTITSMPGRRQPPHCPPARLPRVRRPAAPRARGADRLRRRAEGGLPRRRAVRDAARADRVERNRRRRLEHARFPRRQCRRGGARAHPPAGASVAVGDGDAGPRIVAALEAYAAA